MAKKPSPETRHDSGDAGSGTPDPAERADHDLAGAIRDSTQQIWLAGLGAFAKAQQEGTKVFEALVREGSNLQRRSLAATGDRIGDVTERVASVAEGFSRQATQSWDKLEQVFEERVARALGRLGVPSTRDIRELTGLLNELNEKVSALGEARPQRTARTAKAAKASRTARDGKATKAGTPAKDGKAAGRSVER